MNNQMQMIKIHGFIVYRKQNRQINNLIKNKGSYLTQKKRNRY